MDMSNLLEGEKYVKTLRKANQLELRKPTTALLLLNDIFEYISDNEEEFLARFPKRKFDIKNMGSRIGRVQKKIEKIISTKDGAKTTIKDQLKNADNLVLENKYEKAEHELEQALDIATKNNLDDEIKLIKKKSGEVASKKKVYEEKLDKVNKICESAESKNQPATYSEYISDCEAIIEGATDLNRDDLVKDYTEKIEKTQTKIDVLAKLKLDITELRKAALNSLEEGSVQNSFNSFSEITKKIEEFKST
jgi:hypothetical protein